MGKAKSYPSYLAISTYKIEDYQCRVLTGKKGQAKNLKRS